MVLECGKRNCSDCLGEAGGGTWSPHPSDLEHFPFVTFYLPWHLLPGEGLCSVQLCLISALTNWGLWGKFLSSWTLQS